MVGVKTRYIEVVQVTFCTKETTLSLASSSYQCQGIER